MYVLFIMPRDMEMVEQSLLMLPTDEKEKEAVLTKLHRQFGNPREEVMMNLLKRVKCDYKQMQKSMEMIHGKCKTCKKFPKTPLRPKVSLLAVSEFNKVVTMDLKEVQVQKFKYILHIIDTYMRMSVSVFIKYQKPEKSVYNVMKNGVTVGYGKPRKI